MPADRPVPFAFTWAVSDLIPEEHAVGGPERCCDLETVVCPVCGHYRCQTQFVHDCPNYAVPHCQDCHTTEGQTVCTVCSRPIATAYATTECAACGEPVHRSCAVWCAGCSEVVCNDCSVDDIFCSEGCREEYYSHDNCDEDEPTRETPHILTGETTTLLPVSRAVGVEIEAESKIAYANPIYRLEGCSVGSDGSLNNGVEVRTSPATGTQAVMLVERACSTLKQLNYGIRSSCGLHIHVDARDLVDKNLKGLLAVNLAFEDVIFALQPRSRIGNTYCQPLRGAVDLDTVKNARRVDELWYELQDTGDSLSRRKESHHDGTRYYGLNLHSYWYRGTVEFRQHAGTLDPKKILRWASLCAGMVEASAQRGLDLFPLAERWARQPTYRIDEKTGVSKPNGRKLGALCRLAGLLPDQQQYFSNRLKYRLSVR